MSEDFVFMPRTVVIKDARGRRVLRTVPSLGLDRRGRVAARNASTGRLSYINPRDPRIVREDADPEPQS